MIALFGGLFQLRREGLVDLLDRGPLSDVGLPRVLHQSRPMTVVGYHALQSRSFRTRRDEIPQFVRVIGQLLVRFLSDDHLPQDESETVHVTLGIVGIATGHFGCHVSPGPHTGRESVQRNIGVVPFLGGQTPGKAQIKQLDDALL